MFLSCVAARAADVDPPFAAVVERIRADRGLQNFFRFCPADFAGRVAQRFRIAASPSEADCVGNPELCYRRCGDGDGRACFRLAHAMETATPAAPYEAVEPLFAVACALGEAAGCTNRAAGLRNRDEYDPLDFVSESAESCELRSFTFACEREDAWGCFMLGQAALNGEGGPRDPNLARRSLRKSCRLSPHFEACAAAKRLLPRTR